MAVKSKEWWKPEPAWPAPENKGKDVVVTAAKLIDGNGGPVVDNPVIVLHNRHSTNCSHPEDRSFREVDHRRECIDSQTTQTGYGEHGRRCVGSHQPPLTSPLDGGLRISRQFKH